MCMTWRISLAEFYLECTSTEDLMNFGDISDGVSALIVTIQLFWSVDNISGYYQLPTIKIRDLV